MKGNSVKSRKAGTVKNKFSIVADLNTVSPFKYGVWSNNTLISPHATEEEAVGYINEVRKDYEGMEPDGTVYEEYISQILVECQELVVSYTGLRQDDRCVYTDMCYTVAYNV